MDVALQTQKSKRIKNRVLNEIKDRLSDLCPSIEEFSLGFKTKKYTNKFTKDRKLIKYILSKFHNELNPASMIDYNLMTIEHLYPQSRITEKTYNEDLVGCLGNLILVSPDINNKLSNKSFSEKKTILLDAGYILDDYVLNTEKWHKAQILKRLDWLSTRAYNHHWKL